jgi:hypothetical protein
MMFLAIFAVIWLMVIAVDVVLGIVLVIWDRFRR